MHDFINAHIATTMQEDSHLELERLGILHHRNMPKQLSWMTEDDKRFCVTVGLSMPDGLTAAQVRKETRKTDESLLRLNAYGVVDWETDARGKPSRLVLTVKGDTVYELLVEMARHA